MSFSPSSDINGIAVCYLLDRGFVVCYTERNKERGLMMSEFLGREEQFIQMHRKMLAEAIKKHGLATVSELLKGTLPLGVPKWTCHIYTPWWWVWNLKTSDYLYRINRMVSPYGDTRARYVINRYPIQQQGYFFEDDPLGRFDTIKNAKLVCEALAYSLLEAK